MKTLHKGQASYAIRRILPGVADVTIMEDLDTNEYFTVEENGNFVRLDH